MKYLYAIILLLVCFYTAASQVLGSTEKDAQAAFLKESSQFAALYNGSAPTDYPNIFIGTYYINNVAFTEGSLRYDGIYYERLQMNINAHKDELYVLTPTGQNIVVLHPSLVEYFIFGKEKFIYHVLDAATLSIPSGYYALLHEGDFSFMRRITKKYEERIVATQNQVQRSFVVSKSYYLVNKGVVHSITGKRALLKALASQKKKITAFMGQEDLNFKAEFETACIRCLAYYESINKQNADN